MKKMKKNHLGWQQNVVTKSRVANHISLRNADCSLAITIFSLFFFFASFKFPISVENIFNYTENFSKLKQKNNKKKNYA